MHFQKPSGLFLLSVFLITVLITIIGSHGFLQLRKVNNDLSVIKERNRDIQSEMSQLQENIYKIQNTSLELEKKAREDLGLAKRDEVIYVFPGEQGN